MSERNFRIDKPENNPEFKKGFLIFFILKTIFFEAKLQIIRIENSQKNNKSHKLHADIHFFLITISNLRKNLKSLRDLYPKDVNLDTMWSKYSEELSRLSKFRDHLEHINEGRLEGMGAYNKQPLKNPSILGELSNGDYNFGGNTFNLMGSFLLINNIDDDIENWNIEKNKFPWNDIILGKVE